MGGGTCVGGEDKEEMGTISRTPVSPGSQVSSIVFVQGTYRKCQETVSSHHRYHKSQTTVRTEGWCLKEQDPTQRAILNVMSYKMGRPCSGPAQCPWAQEPAYVLLSSVG